MSFAGSLERTSKLFQIFLIELWDCSVIKKASTFTKAWNLFLNSSIFSTVMFDMVLIVFFPFGYKGVFFVVLMALNSRNPCFVDDSCSRSDEKSNCFGRYAYGFMWDCQNSSQAM
jgi:hypothetical protein